jgi:hypothetical protein
MRMQLVGSAADPAVQGVDALPGKVNYFRGQDAASWQTKVPIYQRVKYSAVYPGVDLVYYGQSQQLEYDFIVAPGADPGTIKLGFAGVEQTTVDAQGDLVLKTAGGPLRFQKPVIFQIGERAPAPIEGGYVHRSPHQIGFRVGAYDRTRPLIIDPVLSYSTYLGGSGYRGGQQYRGRCHGRGVCERHDFVDRFPDGECGATHAQRKWLGGHIRREAHARRHGPRVRDLSRRQRL